MNREKVFICCTTASMIRNFLLDDIKLLISKGYEVHISANFNDLSSISKVEIDNLYLKLREMNVSIYNIEFPRSVVYFKDILKSYITLKQIYKKNNFKFIYCHTPIASIIARLANIKLLDKRFKVIYFAHGFHFYKGGSNKDWLIYYPIELITSYFTDIIITINDEDYNLAEKNFKCSVKKVNGVGINITNNNLFNIDLRELYSLQKQDFILVSVGELNDNKNQIIILEALKKMSNPNLHYFILGVGINEHKLLKFVKDNNMEDNVHFLGCRNDIKEILNCCDCFVMPSYREGLSVALMEAMCSSLPCVVSDIRGNRDLISNGLNGYYACNSDVSTYCDAIKKVINNYNYNSDYKNQISIQNNEFLSKFSKNYVLKQKNDIFNDLKQ